MALWPRFVSTVGPLRIIAVLGGLFVLLGAGRSILIAAAGVPIVAALDGFVLVGGPGIVLLYGRYWLPRSDIRPDAYSRVVAWCFGGLGAMILVVGLIELNPAGSIDRPYFTPLIAMALGCTAGFAVGAHEARAVSRAHDAEEHRDRFRSERDLRERIVETSPVGITVVNADRSIRTANERAAEIVGVPRDEFLGLEYEESMMDATDAEGEPIEESVFQQVLTTGDPVYDAERGLTRPDGRRIWLSVNGAPLRDRAGDVTAVIYAFEDVTERKQLEDDLRETVDRLERSNDRLRQFAYAASHDLQEPLRMVSSYLQHLENQYGDELDSDAREYIAFAVDGADRMRNMVQDLLEYSRLEQRDQEFEQVDCDAVVVRVLDDLEVRIDETDAEIVVGDLPTVRADENQLKQLFQNLVSNAIKYAGDGPPRVEITAEQRTDRWVFSVADEGIGVDTDGDNRIFEVFQRLHTDDEYSGTGIGLALCKKIVEHHDGRIWIESEPDEGSTFSFTLPADEADGPRSPAHRPRDRSRRSSVEFERR